MTRFNNVKSIEFTAKASGWGIVNYNGNDQVSVLKAAGISNSAFFNDDGTFSKNLRLGKRVFYPIEGTDKYGYHLIVDDKCLRNQMFADTMPFHSNNLMMVPEIRYRALANPDLILRGYVFPSKSSTIKRPSALRVESAREVGPLHKNINLVINTRSGKKEKSEEKKDNTLFYTEKIGEIEYKFTGSIDMEILQFIVADPEYDRLEIDRLDEDDNEKIYLESLEKNMINLKPEFKNYTRVGNYLGDAAYERGVLLNEDSVDMLVKKALTKILTLKIKRNGSSFEVNTLTVGVVHDGKKDVFDISLDNLSDYYFGYYHYYQPVEE